MLRMRPTVGALMFGFELGTGVRTLVTGSAPYLAVLVCILVADWHVSLAAGLGFGVGRGLLPLDRFHAGPDFWDGRLSGSTYQVAKIAGLAFVAALGCWFLAVS